MREIHRVLFIRTDRMGDVLMNLPAVRLLRQTYPKSWITFLADKPVAPLLKHHPDLDEVMEVDMKELEMSAAARGRLVCEVRKIKFDLALASNSHKFFHWMMFAAQIPIRVGWRRKWGLLLSRSLPDEKSVKINHEVDSNLRLAGLVSSLKWDGKWNFSAGSEQAEKMEARISKEIPHKKQIIAIHPGTSNPAKRWDAVNFAKLCASLEREGNYAPVLIGGSEEEPVSREVVRLSGEVITDWTGALNLNELTAFLGSPRVRTLVSSDSGPVHIAWIQKKPVVVFYAKDVPGSDPRRWGARSAGSVIFYNSIREITTEEVQDALKRVLS